MKILIRDQSKVMMSDYDSSKMKKNLIFSKEESRSFKPDLSNLGIENPPQTMVGSKNVLYQSNSKYLSENEQIKHQGTVEKQREPIFETKNADLMHSKVNSGLQGTNFINYQNDSFSIEENYVNTHNDEKNKNQNHSKNLKQSP